MVIFLSFLVIAFDHVNWFSWFKNQDTPNFKGFLMVYILFTISKFLVWDKTGFHLAPFRGDSSTLYRSILSNWKYFWKLEKICYIPSNFHKFCFILWYFFISLKKTTIFPDHPVTFSKINFKSYFNLESNKKKIMIS